MLGDDAIVVCMAANPKPQHAIGGIHGQCTIVSAHADGVKTAYALEVERGMTRIRLEELKLFISEGTKRLRQFSVTAPKARRGVMIQSFCERPARWSARASSASLSSLPDVASASNWRSHVAASKAANHSRNVASSLGVRLRMSCSSFSILVMNVNINER
jgi:hypothetical protein